ncbi:MAG: DNA-directed RNA polymerase subunit alpha [Candidatus Komeilibacteria bacterium]
MGLIELPKSVTYKEKKANVYEVVIEPCFPGYGVTLGNSLRRVLLSSLPGAAVTSIKISGVQHEFQTLDHVKEDVVDIILNLKKLNVKLHGDEPVKLEIMAKGEKIVTGADIKPNAQAEVTNLNMVIATLTDKKAVLEMELTISRGRGYLAVDTQSKHKGEIGAIDIDAIFSPVINVGFEIEHVRVGQQTDYERLILNITTDGSITGEQAVTMASDILIEHFGFIKEQSATEVKPKRKSKKAAAETEEVAEAKETSD